MNSKLIKSDGNDILYDADLFSKVNNQWFNVDFWLQQGKVEGAIEGRGKARFIEFNGVQLVLRHYCRGGMVASVTADRYFWTGLKNTRAWREWHLLDLMYQQGLPVPQPVAARVYRHGLFYRADIIIKRIVDAMPLSQRLSVGELSSDIWQKVGLCIRKFHMFGINHADLNAHNILLDGNNNVFLIDFDKGQQCQPGVWQAKNIVRLKRSLDKLNKNHSVYFSKQNWQDCLQGYDL